MTGSVSGRVLIAGTASLLMCLFLSPKFIEFLRRREFGQNIREEGPEGHHAKAGTPTMGGIIIFTAITVPFLVLSHRGWDSLGVFGAAVACALLGFADDYTKIVRHRSLPARRGGSPAQPGLAATAARRASATAPLPRSRRRR